MDPDLEDALFPIAALCCLEPPEPPEPLEATVGGDVRHLGFSELAPA